MTKTELLAKLRQLATDQDARGYGWEEIHELYRVADHALLDFIGDAEVTAAFEDLEEWCA